MKIAEYISSVNNKNEKVLSAFLTAGFPDKESFVETSLGLLDAGADMLEIGIPFSDPLADGPVIQASSHAALVSGIKVKDCLKYTEEIRAKTDKPIALMSYANPILSYGASSFFRDAANAGANGLIIPDLVVEEYENLTDGLSDILELILLCTPTSTDERIRRIDELSKGFVYCVSITGTTGVQKSLDHNVIDAVKNAYSIIKKNKMLVGFGISKKEDKDLFAPYCDGVIVGSAIIKALTEGGRKQAERLMQEIKQVS